MNRINVDADCELDNVANWPAVLWSVTEKTTDNPHSGTRCLKLTKQDTRSYGITRNTGNQAAPTYARIDLISGWYRTDGYGNFRVCTSSGTTLFLGGSPTAWTYFQVATFSAANLWNFYLQAYRGADTRETAVWIDDCCIATPTALYAPDFLRRRQ